MTQLTPLLSELRAGDRLGRYELVCMFTQGGMGAIWLARMYGQHGFERLVALKTILPMFSAEEKFRAMFLDEARIASRIEHPNVVSLSDVGEESGHLYFAMEYIEGESLRHFYKAAVERDGVFPVALALRLVADACAGIHAAHELRDEEGNPLEVVHRDLSPHNLLLSARGQVKIIDFGVARARDRLTQATESGTLKGKINYMSPEQARGGELDRRADVYALGAVLYHLLLGHPPYDTPESTQMSVLQKLLFGQSPEIPDAKLPRKVRAILECALAPHADNRFATAEAMRLAIEDALLPHRITSQDVEVLFERHLGARMRDRRAAIQGAVNASRKRARAMPLVPAAPQSMTAPSMTQAGTSVEMVPAAAAVRRGVSRWLLFAACLSCVALGFGIRQLGNRAVAVSAPVDRATPDSDVVPREPQEVRTAPPAPVSTMETSLAGENATTDPSRQKTAKKKVLVLAPVPPPKKPSKPKVETVDDGF